MEFDDFFNGEGFKKISFDQFDEFINRLELKPEYSVFENEKGELIINEEWTTSKNKSIRVTRLYKFDVNILDSIDKKNEILNKALEIYVSNENYEQAAIIRDIINSTTV